MDIEISEMTLSDYNNIKEILLLHFDNFWNKAILKEELINPNSKYIIAKIGNEIVGFAGIKIILDEADIMNIVTKKSFRNKGIGSFLLKNLITISKNSKVKSINLEVNEENLSAIHLYEKNGFEIIGTRKNYYKNKNAIIMKKYN